MRLKIMSDLHFEFHKDKGNSFIEHDFADKADVLIIAGDLSDFALLPESLEKICLAYHNALVIFVPGNHEFYGSSIPETLSVLTKLARKIPNLKCLYNGRFVHEGVKFFGTTLWFKHVDEIEDLYPQMNDFYYIDKFASQVYIHNQTALDFLWHADMKDSVVITHMLPSVRSVQPRFIDNVLNPFFVCEVDNIILSKSPKYWFHGHCHRSADYVLDKTRVVANPMGYIRRDYNLDFNYDLILEI